VLPRGGRQGKGCNKTLTQVGNFRLQKLGEAENERRHEKSRSVWVGRVSVLGGEGEGNLVKKKKKKYKGLRERGQANTGKKVGAWKQEGYNS